MNKYKPKTHVTIELLKRGGFCESVKRYRIKLAIAHPQVTTTIATLAVALVTVEQRVATIQIVQKQIVQIQTVH